LTQALTRSGTFATIIIIIIIIISSSSGWSQQVRRLQVIDRIDRCCAELCSSDRAA